MDPQANTSNSCLICASLLLCLLVSNVALLFPLHTAAVCKVRCCPKPTVVDSYWVLCVPTSNLRIKPDSLLPAVMSDLKITLSGLTCWHSVHVLQVCCNYTKAAKISSEMHVCLTTRAEIKQSSNRRDFFFHLEPRVTSLPDFRVHEGIRGSS